jgi:phytoene synthase
MHFIASLAPYAKSLGAAFQKINFLRDMNSDLEERGRVYFPGIDLTKFDEFTKQEILKDIQLDFDNALKAFDYCQKVQDAVSI